MNPNNPQKAITKAITLIITIIIIITTTACAPTVIRQTSAPDLPGVDPKAQAQAGRKTVRLYFRVSEEAFISSELRRIDVNADETDVEAAFKGLAAGPDAALSRLTPLIPEGAQIKSAEKSGEILFLTLTGEFLNPAAIMPDGWQVDSVLREAALLEKRLALCALTNTFAEMGACNAVQFRIEEGANVTGVPDEIAALFEAGPLAYSNDFLLTPAHALEAALKAVSEKSWKRASRLVTSPDQLTESIVSADLMPIGELADFTIGEDSTASDGETAVVTATVYIRAADGVTRSRENIPVRVLRVQEVFRVEYESLLRLLGVSEGSV